MMETGRPPARTLPEALVRALRHEVGDLLQKVYATVAILKDRLSADKELERGVLVRLGSRAAACKHVLDTAHDFVCPVNLDLQPVDLAALAASVAAVCQERHPHLEVAAEGEAPAVACADPKRAAQIAELLLANACEAAQKRVSIRTTARLESREVEWAVSDDGPGAGPEVEHQLFTPFFTTRSGHTGLGLPLVRKLSELHGGRVTAANSPQGGLVARVIFPTEPPAASC
jgi:signal transduction histidine kinase